MYQKKRYLRFNEFYYGATKRLRSLFNEEDTCIEHLSNELFYEIFEYLDGCNIYKAFCNLNARFQHLITHSSFPLKIDLPYLSEFPSEYYDKNVIIPNKHRIISLHIRNQFYIDKFLLNSIIDSTFIRLQAIILYDITSDKLILLLFHLKSLARLFSLIVYLNSQFNGELDNLYQMIFSLPTLKYNKLSSSFHFGYRPPNVPVLFAPNEQFSTIEHLVVDHHCTLNELTSMLRHTPRLRRLTCNKLIKSVAYFKIERPITLFNLTYISIAIPQVNFVEFEMFMRKLSIHIQVLYIRSSSNVTYLDADRWKKLIIEHMPHLRIFNFEYREYLIPASFNAMIYWCTFPFWSERQWFFEFKIDNGYIALSIGPSRKTWLDIHQHAEVVTYFDQNINNNSTQHSIISKQQNTNRSQTKIQLSINNCSIDKREQRFIDSFKPVFVIVQFTCLNINCKDISVRMLLRIIYLLPNLDSLKVSCLPVMKSDWLLNLNLGVMFLLSTKNKITKVNLEKTMEVEQVHFFLYLCYFLQYLQVAFVKHTDLEIIVRFILMKVSTYMPHLNCLCLDISNIDEGMAYKLQKMIDIEKLLANCTIKRISNTILLQWK